MKQLILLTVGTALLVSSCAPRYTASPPDAGATPDPDALLKSMSASLASAKTYRLTATRTISDDLAKKMRQPSKTHVDVAVARPDKLAVKVSGKTAVRSMIFDGRAFTVVDEENNFYSTAPLRGTLNLVPASLEKIYGFQPPLAEFIVSDPYQDIKHRVTGVSYLGRGSVREGGKTVQCHRIGLHGTAADAELWLGGGDSLPRRLKATAKNSGSRDLLMDVDFLSWDMNPPLSGSTFDFKPRSGAVEIPMISLAEAKTKSR
ncbi:MAG: hypothetical protein RLZZ214_4296 [Verrucomicrobiota bacterium]|jgi:hypothetical protein